jgi:hypothetical protein
MLGNQAFDQLRLSLAAGIQQGMGSRCSSAAA